MKDRLATVSRMARWSGHPLRWACWIAFLMAQASVLVAAPLDPENPDAWAIPEPDLYALTVQGELVCAVGYWGSVILSRDGGRSFGAVTTPVREALFDVDFFDERIGWAVGARGTLLATSDGGHTWQSQEVFVDDGLGDRLPLDVSLFGVHAVSATEAWAVGDAGVVLRTRDAASWQQIPLSEELLADDNLTERILNAVRFADARNGWIVGEFGTVLHSADGGDTWTRQPRVSESGEEPYLFDVSASLSGPSEPGSPSQWAQATAVGLAGRVWLWNRQALRWDERPIAGGESLYAVAQRDSQLVAVGDRGAIYWTSDRAATWQRADTPRVLGWLRSVAFGPEDRVFVVGAKGAFLRSPDGGRSFERVQWRPLGSPEMRPASELPQLGRALRAAE